MELSAKGPEGQVLEMVIDNEDLAVAEIIHQELLKDEHVQFAGVAPAHPLLRRLLVRVQTKRVKPPAAVVEAGERAVAQADAILEAMRKALPPSPTAT